MLRVVSGRGAVNPSEWGKVITIECIIPRSGSSKVRVLDEANHIKKTRRDDLKALSDWLCIDPSNPLMYMSQEEMKRFTRCSPKELYSYLASGTGLESTAKDLEGARESIVRMKEDLDKQRERVEELGAEQSAKAREYAVVQEILEAEQRVLDAKQMAAWAEALEAKEVVAEKTEALERSQGRVEAVKSKIGELRTKQEVLVGEADAAKSTAAAARSEATRRQAELETAIRSLEMENSSQLKQLSAEATDLVRDRKRLDRDLRDQESKEAALMKSREGRPGHDELVAAQAREREAQEAEREVMLELNEAREEREPLSDAVKEAQERCAEVQSVVDERRREITRLERMVRDAMAESSRTMVPVAPGIAVPSELLDCVHPMMPKIVSCVSRVTAGRIIGPLGALFQLREDSQAFRSQADVAINKMARCFVATRSDDVLRAKQALKDAKLPPIAQFIELSPVPESDRDRLMTRDSRMPAGCKAFFDIVDVDRLPTPTVAIQALVDSTQGVGNMALSQLSAGDAAEVCRGAAGRFHVIDVDGSTHTFLRGRAIAKVVPKPASLTDGRTMFPKSTEDIVSTWKERLAQEKRAAEEAERGFPALKDASAVASARLREADSRLKSFERRSAELVRAYRKAVDEKERIAKSLSEDLEEQERFSNAMEEIQSFKSDTLKRIRKNDEQTAVIHAKRAHVKKDLAPKMAELEAKKRDVEASLDTTAVDQRAQSLVSEVDAVDRAIHQLTATKLKVCEQQARADDEALRAARDAEASRIARVKVATGMDEAPQLVYSKSKVEWAEEVRRLQALHDDGRRQLRERGIDPEQLVLELQAAKAAYEDAKGKYDRATKARKDLADHLHHSTSFFHTMTKQVEDDAVAEFPRILRRRGHAGSVQFKVDSGSGAKSCHVTVSTHVAAGIVPSSQPSSSSSLDLGSLSGGEKSLTSVALLLAFGKSSRSPWRMFDEFDVFMDEANRKIAMSMLRDIASEAGGESRQLICLTPLDVSSAIVPGPNLTVLQLQEPVRSD
jgi:structural maintenance of chromosomes protein 6